MTTLKETFASIADAIREKDGLTAKMTPAEMPARISAIQKAEGNFDQFNFKSRTDLKKLELPSKYVTVDTSQMQVLSSTFQQCTYLTELSLPDGFGEQASTLKNFLYSCTCLSSLQLGVGFGTMADDVSYCFYNCSKLSSIEFQPYGESSEGFEPNDGFGSYASKYDYCFYGCQQLSSLKVPSGFGVTNSSESISMKNCFFNCTHLQDLYVPENFGLGVSSFTNCFSCPKLSSIHGGIHAGEDFADSYLILSNTVLVHDSIMETISALQEVSVKKRLSLGSTLLKKLTADEKKIATSKGWTLL